MTKGRSRSWNSLCLWAIIVGGLCLPMIVRAEEGWTMTAVGDIMLDRQVRTLINRNGLEILVKPVRAELKGDIVLGNLEGPFTSQRSIADATRLIFTFDPKQAPVLKRLGFNTLSLANNHSLNFGQSGLDSTRRTLRAANMQYFGDPKNIRGHSFIRVVRNQRIGLVGYHGLVTGKEEILKEIRAIKKRSDVVVVMPHWGAEYVLTIQPKLQREARELIDVGADLVIGAHPHVVEPIEIYKGKLIAYSLGNFLFDQYWSAETQRGLMLSFSIRHKQLTVRLKPLTMTRSVVALSSEPARASMLERIAKNSAVSESQRAAIRRGTLLLSVH